MSNSEEEVLKIFRAHMKNHTEEMLTSLGILKIHFLEGDLNTSHINILKSDFLNCRNAYKKIQFFSSYFFNNIHLVLKNRIRRLIFKNNHCIIDKTKNIIRTPEILPIKINMPLNIQ